VICPVCSARLEVLMVIHDATGVPDLAVRVLDEGTIARDAWDAVEQAALLREAERGEKDDPTW
jgi:hypothetical protein